MNSPTEYFDVVDDQDQVTGRAPRAVVHARGWRHRAVHVLLFNRAGELFVQKRAPTKDTAPGCYDSSASGHVDAGEDYDACARRELFEELGIQVAPARLVRHFKIAADEATGWEFVWVYSLRGDEPPLINRAEIESGMFLRVAEIERQMTANPAAFARSFVKIFGEFQRQRLAGRGTATSSCIQ